MRFDTQPTFDFRPFGAYLPPLASATNPPAQLQQTITGAAPPTITNTGKGLKFSLTSASQAQCVQLNFNDKLGWPIEKIALVAIDAYIPAADPLSGAASKVFIGLGSAMNAAYASMTALAGFSCAGSGNWYAETDDNVNDKAADTGITPATDDIPRTFWIDLYSGVVRGQGATPDRGGKGSVRFYMDGSGAGPNRGNRRSVCLSTDFNMENYADGTGLQPILQIEKASGTTTGSIVITRYRAWLRDPL